MQGLGSQWIRLAGILGMLLVFLVAAGAWLMALVMIPWMALIPFLDQLQPAWVTEPTYWLIGALIAFIPLVMAMRLSWVGLERLVELYWQEDWNRWQAWKVEVSGRAAVSEADGRAG
ncbi:MAG: hypothetical protein JJU36_16025 [Phycisphaeraceae bacterium]|nr:hypothetical protein [Phycisphaeraceae bacterium]